MAFYTEHIHIDGSINIDGSIFQWNSLFTGGGGPGGGVSQAYVDGSLAKRDASIAERALILNPDFGVGLVRMNGPTQDADTTVLKINHRASSVISGTVIELGADYTTAHTKIIGYSNPAGTTSSQFGVKTYNGTWVLGLYQNEDGKIGIRTNTPGYQLDVSGNLHISQTGGSATPALLFENGGTVSAKNISGTFQGVWWPRWTNDAMYLDYGAGGFHIRDSSSVDAVYFESGRDAKFYKTVTCQDYIQVLDTTGTEGFKIVWNDTEKTVDTIIN